jgi:hypothetical protein
LLQCDLTFELCRISSILARSPAPLHHSLVHYTQQTVDLFGDIRQFDNRERIDQSLTAFYCPKPPNGLLSLTQEVIRIALRQTRCSISTWLVHQGVAQLLRGRLGSVLIVATYRIGWTGLDSHRLVTAPDSCHPPSKGFEPNEQGPHYQSSTSFS